MNTGRWLGLAALGAVVGAHVASCGGTGVTGSDFLDAGASSTSSGAASSGSIDASLHDAPAFGGGDSTVGDGASSGGCTPQTCAQLGYDCGKAVSCGTVIDCTGTGTGPDGCPAGQTCGASQPNVCGSGSGSSSSGAGDGGSSGSGDGGSTCTPQTCAQLGFDCGQAVTCETVINCNANGSTSTPDCPAGEICGANGKPNVCGGASGGDGGSTSCTPKTCAGLGYNCGLAGDGCNGTLNCNANGSTTTPDCPAGQICGYGNVPNVCGPSSIASGCEGGTTTLTGFVYDPADSLPIYNALVYVPAGPVQTPTSGVDGTCGCVGQPAFASTFTAVDGSFTLPNPPAGSNVTVVVQLGKWQRAFTETITPCVTNTLPTHLTLPSTRAQGNIPRFAIDTGSVDVMECVLLKMGIAQSEFVNPAIAGGVPTAAGRVQLYHGTDLAGISGQGGPTGGEIIDKNTPAEAALIETASVMNSYDVILFPCKGGEALYDAANGFPNALGNLLAYGTAGGRFFTTHYSYVWLFQNGAYANTATWEVNHHSYADTTVFTGYVNQGFATGATLAQWLQQPAVGASTTLGQIPVQVVRNDISAVAATSELWMSSKTPTDPANFPLHYTFDTPVGGTACGRGVFSDFHVENANNAEGQTFPSQCSAGKMTAQEKLLEFMLFDLTSCVSTPTCTPLTCANYPANTCGTQSDGCGGLTQDCGQCVAPQTCGGGGVPSQCGTPDAGTCQQLTCQQQGITCGPAGDGCGGLIPSCGTCPTGQTCVGGQCIGEDAGADSGPPICVPKTCAQQGIQCGIAGDGCGNIQTCPSCPAGQTCNSNGQCQTGSQ